MKYFLSILFVLILNQTYGFDPRGMDKNESECKEYFETGMDYFELRAKGARDWMAKSAYIDKAIKYFGKSLECPSYRQKSGYYLLRSLHFKAMYTDIPEKTRKKYYNEVKKLGEKLTEEYPKDVGIKMWYLAGLGKWIQYYGIFRAAYDGLGPKTKAIAESIIDIDPDYENGVGYRILAILYYQAPYIPVLLTWPDDEKAIAFAKKALKINPDNIGNLLFMGKIYYLDEQFEKARFYLNKCTKQKPREDYLIMERFDQMKARHYLEMINSKENGQN